MRIFRFMRVESLLLGSVYTDSLRMLLSSSDNDSSFTIKSLRLIGPFTFLAFFQSWLTHVNLSFLLCAMTLKILLVGLLETSVAVWMRNCMRLCVGCTAFAHVGVQLCAM